MDFNKYSYELHKKRHADGSKYQIWKNKSSVDYWRHTRMYSGLDPVLQSFPKSTWLTVGDGRYGTDAHYIASFGNSVLATDLSEERLKEAKSDGFIQEYQVENAEDLSFEDGSFDFVLCKESYHHFPRPMIALYEMIRVARQGVILIEPNDDKIIIPQKLQPLTAGRWFWQALKNGAKRVIGRQPFYEQGQYEESGNYVFTVSARELEKVGLGMNLPLIALKGLNDHYVEDGESEPIGLNGPIQKEIKRTIKRKDRASSRGLQPWGMLTAIIFKKDPGPSCRKLVVKEGYTMNDLQRNPFDQL